MSTGPWSVQYNPAFGKTVVKKAKQSKGTDSVEPPGTLLDDSNLALRKHLQGLAHIAGWRFRDGVAIQVARDARSFRTPAPRHSASTFPVRST